MRTTPLCIDLYCGLGGWADGFLAEGYDVVGFDIKRHDYGTGGYPGQLVLQDVLTLQGAQFKDAACIVASPPCQAYSYMAMPWTRAKKMAQEIRASQTRWADLNTLFVACFRIQAEASATAGHHIPMIVENVKGAQPWVGRATAHYGSFYLWGDVDMVGDRIIVDRNYGELLRSPGRRMKYPSHCGPRMWREREVVRLNDSIMAGLDRATKKWTTGWNVANAQESRKNNRQINAAWRAKHYEETDKMDLCYREGLGRVSSGSNCRKAASAEIAKIPFPLACHIARAFKRG